MSRVDGPTEEDAGNVVALEHVNITVPDQGIATLFYIVGLGLTRDPYLTVGVDNMWVNVGQQQFHLPTRPAQVIPGFIGLVVPDLQALQDRLRAVEGRLAGTKFAWQPEDGHLSVTCPWGNQIRCYAASSTWGGMLLGMPYVELWTRPGTAAGIARCYQSVLGAPVQFDEEAGATQVAIGSNQRLVFRETTRQIPPYDGHHIAVYVADFSGPYGFLQARGLVSEEIRNHQFRFQELVDPDSGEPVFTLEHEVRSLRHPMYRRPLVNRNPDQTQRSYAPGHDAFPV